MPISFAVPGIERKRTRLKAPATATPVPTLPLTIMMTTHTTAGSSASVTAKFFVQRVRYIYIPVKANPITSEQPTHSRKSPREITVVAEESNIPLNIVSSIK